ncbi:MAG: hypothetical protein ABIN91_19755 [Mucilaginibacter sp.]|uniref:hypothetical protein n=1 Tax=Mucilaginibacter sp. TaxID=1882438 RepID=UPI003267463B
MKKVLTACLLFVSSLTFAQQTVQRSAKLPNSDITETFSVLRSDKKIKQGEYTATAGNNTTLAQGTYLNGERAGIWSFYNISGKLIQTYNYTDNQLTFADSTDTKGLQYVMAGVKTDDDVTVPVKIGGSYSFRPTFLSKVLTQAINKDFGPVANATFIHTFSLNSKGEVTNHQVKVCINGQNKLYQVDDSELDHDLTRFAPAMVNNNPIPCKVITTNTVAMSNGNLPDYANSTYLGQ